jgi:hypothetical protein
MSQQHSELIGKTVKVSYGRIFKVQSAYGRIYRNPNRADHGKYLYNLAGFDDDGVYCVTDVKEGEFTIL